MKTIGELARDILARHANTPERKARLPRAKMDSQGSAALRGDVVDDEDERMVG